MASDGEGESQQQSWQFHGFTIRASNETTSRRQAPADDPQISISVTSRTRKPTKNVAERNGVSGASCAPTRSSSVTR